MVSGRFWLFHSHRFAQLLLSLFVILLSSADLSEGCWREVINAVPLTSADTADLWYYRGMAFARKEEWKHAEEAFQQGVRLAPDDKRMHQELAGVYFRQGEVDRSKKALERAMELDPRDHYTNTFLATLYLLEENLEAAVQQWNHIAKPEIDEIIVDPPSTIDPELLDSAFAAAPASVLNRDELLATLRRLEMLDAFSRFRLDLQPQANEKFHLVLRPIERSSWKSGPYKNLLGTFRGIFAQTVRPEFHNMNGQAVNFDSILRWDKEKLWAKGTLSMPFAGNAAHRLSWYGDWRKEEWDLPQSVEGPLFAQDFLELTHTEFGMDLQSRPAGRWGWGNSIAISNSEFTNNLPSLNSTSLFNDGWTIHYRAWSEFDWLRLPQQRFTIKSAFKGSISKTFDGPSTRFGTLTAETEAVWYPQSKGDDFLNRLRFRLGKGFGELPFDQLFILGVKSDTKLLMRAHKEDGRKGGNPMGTDYVLINYNIDKIIHTNSFFDWKLAPFIDIGKINDRNGIFAPREWLVDTGIQSKFGVLKSINVVLTYGRNLRNGSDVFFVAGSNEF